MDNSPKNKNSIVQVSTQPSKIKKNPIENLGDKKGIAFYKGHPRYGGVQKGYVSPTSILREMMGKTITIKNKKTKKKTKKLISEVLIAKHLNNAIKGDRASIEDILDRLDGKALERSEVTGLDGGPLTIEWQK